MGTSHIAGAQAAGGAERGKGEVSWGRVWDATGSVTTITPLL